MTDNTSDSEQVANSAETAATTTLDVQTKWPARYYASYNTAATGPIEVTGWYDVWKMSSTDLVPAAADMLALTADQWSARLPFGQGVQAGSIVAYAPASTITLADQAEAAYRQALHPHHRLRAGTEYLVPELDQRAAICAAAWGHSPQARLHLGV